MWRWSLQSRVEPGSSRKNRESSVAGAGFDLQLLPFNVSRPFGALEYMGMACLATARHNRAERVPMRDPAHRPPMTSKDLRLLIDKSVNAWVDDYAPSMGAAIAFYTLFSVAPLFILIIAVAGFVFGEAAAEGAIVLELQGRIGLEGAAVVQSLIKSVSKPAQGVIATLVSILTLLLGASSVFGELQSALNRIWRVPDPSTSGILRNFLRGRLLSFAMVLGLGFLLLLSLAFSTFLSAVGEWSNRWFSGWQTVLQAANFLVSFLVNAVIFAMIYKAMPRARIAWRDVGIGATVTALLFEISKLLIGLYLGSRGLDRVSEPRARLSCS
jgi:membrane protein